MRTTIESMLRQKIGLDANSISSNAISYAIEQRRLQCNLPDLKTYCDRIQSSPKEFEALIEAVVVPETWFFRDQEPFVYLRQWSKAEWHSQTTLRVLSAPCSTGEEPYSIAITLLEAGLNSEQFRIDALDISQTALQKAKQATYSKRSFRGGALINPAYFQSIGDRYEVRSPVRKTVNFIQENLLEPKFLIGRQYQVIFCRNLWIYLEEGARSRLMKTLDQALTPSGLLVVGAAETAQIPLDRFQSVHYPSAFAYRKLESKPHSVPSAKPPPPPERDAIAAISKLEQAQHLVEKEKFAEAAQLCESHLRVERTDANAYLLLGKIYQALDQIQQAEAAFQKAIYLNPKSYEALIELALLKEHQGDITTATLLRARVQRILNL
jgi:chemotaxis protein methyltransferase WspC